MTGERLNLNEVVAAGQTERITALEDNVIQLHQALKGLIDQHIRNHYTEFGVMTDRLLDLENKFIELERKHHDLLQRFDDLFRFAVLQAGWHGLEYTPDQSQPHPPQREVSEQKP